MTGMQVSPTNITSTTTRFSSINRRGSPGYSPGWQRHHLLPRQLLSCNSLKHFFAELVPQGLGFENFGANGVLLPATERLALKHGLPLHRGPHRLYNELVLERVTAIEMSWSQSRKGRRAAGGTALDRAVRQRADGDALERMALLQRAPSGDPLYGVRKWQPFPISYPCRPHAPLAALRIARTLAVATSSSMPTPQIVSPPRVIHST
jgi:hypothetical protein